MLTSSSSPLLYADTVPSTPRGATAGDGDEAYPGLARCDGAC